MPQSAQEIRNIKAAKRANQLWNAREIDPYLATLASDHVFRSVALPEPIIGPEAYRQFLNSAFEAMPDWRISEPDERPHGVALNPPIFASGDLVTVPSLNSGTRTDGFLNLPPSDGPWSFFSCTVYQFRKRDGKVQATWAYWNPINVLQDLGIDPTATFQLSPPAGAATSAQTMRPPPGAASSPATSPPRHGLSGSFGSGPHHDESLSDVMVDVARFPFRMWSKTLRVFLRSGQPGNP